MLFKYSQFMKLAEIYTVFKIGQPIWLIQNTTRLLEIEHPVFFIVINVQFIFHSISITIPYTWISPFKRYFDITVPMTKIV